MEDEGGGDAERPRITKRSSSSNKKRSTRACDQCRKAKSRCDLPPDGGSCTNCVGASIECTTSGPTRKRGPPKGYLHAVETRLHEVEALVGIILSTNDPRGKAFVRDLSRDSYAKSIMERVDAGQFGPTGRQNAQNAVASPSDNSPPSPVRKKDSEQPFVKGPTAEWQDRVIAALGSRSTSGDILSAFGSTASSSLRRNEGFPASISQRHHAHAESEDDRASTSDRDDSPDTESGQFSIDTQQQLHYHGGASGLHLLSKSDRDDTSNKEGLWQESYKTDDLLSVAMPALPHITIRKQLLEVYFTSVHPTFPVIPKSLFWKDFSQRETVSATPSDPFNILLLTLFSLAAQVIPSANVFPNQPDQVVTPPGPGTFYFEQARAALYNNYNRSHPTTCQSLLLLGIREVGMGNIPQAWMFVGMAIRMAQDLGLHKSAEDWTRNGQPLFDEDQLVVRRRLWCGCVKVDRYLSMYMGRPLAIRDTDWDTQLPDESPGQEEEVALWKYPPTQNPSGFYTPTPGRLLSSFKANVALTILIGKILQELYTIHSSRRTPNLGPVADLKAQLNEWLENIPAHLKVTDHNTMFKAPPSMLTLHTEYWCAIILLHRPFLRVSKGSTSTEGDDLKSSAWEQCLTAAQHINDLAKAWKINFLLEHSSAFFVYDIFHAGLIWVAALTFRPIEPRFVANLNFCLDALNEMQKTHPLAARCHQLLQGAKVSPHANIAGSGVDSSLGSYLTPDVEQLLLSIIPGAAVDPSYMNGYFWSEMPLLHSHGDPSSSNQRPQTSDDVTME